MSGITYHQPIVEWVLAAKWAGYRFFHGWQELEADQQEFLIAAYRLDAQASAVSTHYRRRSRRRG